MVKILKLLTKWDKIIIGTLLLLSLLAEIIIFKPSSGDNKEVLIRVGGKIVKEIQLVKSSQSKKYSFDFNGNVGYIEMKNGKVRMLEMNKSICPNAICSNTGWVSESYQPIVCLPNKIEVTINSSDKSSNGKNNDKNRPDVVSSW